MDTRGRPEKHDDSDMGTRTCKAIKNAIHVYKIKYIKLPSRPQEKAATKVLGRKKKSED